MGAFYNQLGPVHIETGTNNNGANICYQVNDDDSIVLVLDCQVDY